MATEDDILKSLIRIEQALKSSTVNAGLGRAPRGGGTARDNDEKEVTKAFKATVAGFTSLTDTSGKLTKSFSGLSKTVLITRDNFVQMNRSMRTFVRGAPITPAPGAPGGGKLPPNPMLAGLGKIGNALGTALTPVNAAAKPLIGTLTAVRLGLVSFLASLGSGAEQVVTDFFALHARGIDATSSLGGLYVNALKAGMGLQEYLALLEESGPAVVRFTNFDEFNKRITATNEQLAGLGIFGDEASKLAGQLATSTVVLGVPMSQMADATTRQVGLFEQLRKTTMMTAEGFRELMVSLQDNADVQGLLLGLAANERAARLADIAQTQALGYQMGLTKTASKQLGDALIAQRKLTVEQRFKAAGGIRQVGGLAGLSPGDVETLARLTNLKVRTAEENKLFVELGGQFLKGQEMLANSGDINNERLAERMDAVTEALRPQLEGIRKAQLAREAGEVTPRDANKEFGQGASLLVQGAGKLLAYAEAAAKNPIASALTQAIGSAAFTFGLGAIIGKTLGKLPMFGGAAAVAATAGGGGLLSGVGKTITGAFDLVKSGASKIFGFFKGDFLNNLGKAATSAFDLMKSGVGKIFGLFSGGFKALGSWMGDLLAGAGNLFKGGAGLLGKLLKAIPGIGTIVSVLFEGLGEVFTGNITAAFNEDGGGWLERIGNTIFASVKSVFSGLASLVDGVIKLFGFEDPNFENAVDKAAAFLRGAFFTVLSKVTSIFGENTLSRYFEEASDNSFKVLDQLRADQAATITSLGEKNKATAKKAKEAANEVADAVSVSAGVITTTKNLTPQLVAQAKTIASTPAPAVAPPAVVVPEPAASAAQAANAPAGTAGARATPPTETTFTDLSARLTEMVTLLQQSLEIEKLHSSFTESILRATNRPIFGDVDSFADRIVRPNLYGD